MKKIALVVLASGCLLGGSVMARDYKDEYSVAEWRIAKGNPVWGAQLLQVCLFRDKTRTGFFSFGEWKSKIGDSSTDCEEKLIADLEKKLLYFDFSPSAPDFSPGGYFSGRADVHCSHSAQGRGVYTPCSSAFFSVPGAGMESYRVLTTSFWKIVRDESKTISALDSIVDERRKARDAEEYEAYIKNFNSLNTLKDITVFEDRYKNKDPDRLIEKIAPRKREFLLAIYREKFTVARSSDDLKRFIEEYQSDDPDGLTPRAKERLESVLRAEAVEQDLRNRELLEARKRKEINDIEMRIVGCNRQIASAYATIDREREIARVSGYENKMILRQAGEFIVECRAAIKRDYDLYKKSGGGKRLDDLK